MLQRLNAIRSGNSVTVYHNGVSTVFTHDREDDAKALFRTVQAVKANPTEENVATLKALLDPFYKIAETEQIERDRNGNLYLKGFNTPMPRLLREKFREYINEGFDLQPLVNFWKLLLANPDKHVRESLYDFASHFNFPITDMGYFIAYKSVAFAGKRVEPLALKVANEYIAVRARGENPKDFVLINYRPESPESPVLKLVKINNLDELLNKVYSSTTKELPMKDLLNMAPEEREAFYDEESGKYLVKEEILTKDKVKVEGNLAELFETLGDMFKEVEGEFTDHHTRKMRIRMGEPVRMKREDCDNDPEVTCSSGLHVGTPQYVSTFGGSGSYILACLVNPMNVVAVPVDYKGQKMRCCEYLPYSICEFEDGVMKEIDTKYFEEDYINYEVQELEALLAEAAEKEQDPEDQTVEVMTSRLKDIKIN